VVRNSCISVFLIIDFFGKDAAKYLLFGPLITTSIELQQVLHHGNMLTDIVFVGGGLLIVWGGLLIEGG
jgi:hypothetical protein